MGKMIKCNKLSLFLNNNYCIVIFRVLNIIKLNDYTIKKKREI